MNKDVKKISKFGFLEVLNAGEGDDKKTYTLKPGSFAIGSSLNVRIRLPSKNVQDIHCIINVDENGVATLTSQSIFHPTILNNKSMQRFRAMVLRSNDIFDVVDTKFLYRNDLLTEEDLQQKSISMRRPKAFATPRRPSHVVSRTKAFIDRTTKASPSVSRLQITPKKRSSISEVNEWSTGTIETNLLPGPVVAEASGDPKAVESSTTSYKTPESKIVASTPLKRIQSELSSDGKGSEKFSPARKSMRLVKTDSNEILSQKIAGQSWKELAVQASSARELNISLPGRRPRSVSRSSKYANYIFYDDSTKFKRSESFTDITTLTSSQSEQRQLRARVSNEKRDTSKPTRSSAVKGASKSEEQVLEQTSTPTVQTTSIVTRKGRSRSVTRRLSESVISSQSLNTTPKASPTSPFLSYETHSSTNTQSANKKSKSNKLSVEKTKQVTPSSVPLFSKGESRSCKSEAKATNGSKPASSSSASIPANITKRRSRSIDETHQSRKSTPKMLKFETSIEGTRLSMLSHTSSSGNLKTHRSPYKTGRLSVNRSADLLNKSENSCNDSLDTESKKWDSSLEDLSETFDSSTRSSHIETTNSSSFIYENLLHPVSSRSLQHAEPLLNITGVELLETPKQKVKPEDTRSLKKSSRKSKVKVVESVLNSPMQNLTVEDSLSADDNTSSSSLFSSTSGENSPTFNISAEVPDSPEFSKGETVTARNKAKSLKVLKKIETPNDLGDDHNVKQMFKIAQAQKSHKNYLSDVNSAEQKLKTPRPHKSPKNDLSDVVGVKQMLKTPKAQKPPKNDLSDVVGVKQMLKTPKAQKPPKNDLSDVVGVKQMLRTPKAQKPPKNDLSDVVGVKQMLKTPRAQNFPKHDLSDLVGVNQLFKTPKPQASPKNDLSDVVGVRQILKTPKPHKSPKNDLSDIVGVKQSLKTPKPQKLPINDLSDFGGVRQLLATPVTQKPPKNDLSNPYGLSKLFEETKVQKTPKNDLSDVRGVKGILKTPKALKSPKNDLSDLRGVKKLLATPVIQKSPNNDLTNIVGVKELLKTPKIPKSPNNDLSKPYGVKKLLATPKAIKSPRNDLSNVTGVKKLLRSPKVPRSPRNALEDLSGVDKLFDFDEILNTMQVVKTDNSRLSVLSNRDAEKTPRSDHDNIREQEVTAENQTSTEGVLTFNESQTAFVSDKFGAVFKKKPVRTYRSQSATPPVLSRIRRIRSVDTSPIITPRIADWVKSVTQQMTAKDPDSDEIPLLSKDSVNSSKNNNLGSKASLLSSPPHTSRQHSVKGKLDVNSTPNTEPEVTGIIKDVSKKKGTKRILKETLNDSNAESLVAQKKKRKIKDVAETVKENVTPASSEVSSDIPRKKVTFAEEETRRSQRTPRKPSKYLEGYILGLGDVMKQLPNKKDKEPPSSVEPATRKRKNKTAAEGSGDASAVKRKKGKQKIVGENVEEIKDPHDNENNEKDEKLAKRRYRKQESSDNVNVCETEKLQAGPQESEEDKRPVRTRTRRQINKKTVDQCMKSESQNERDAERKGRGQELVNSEQAQSELEVETSREERPARKRGRRATTKKANQVENHDESPLLQKTQSKETVDQSKSKDLTYSETEEPLTVKRGRRGRPKQEDKKAQQTEQEEKRAVKTRARKLQAVKEQTDSDKSETDTKPLSRNKGEKKMKSADSETSLSEDEVFEKPVGKKRGRKPAAEQSIVNGGEVNTTENLFPVPVRRTTRKGATKQINPKESDDNISSQSGKKSRLTKQEIAEKVPIRQSARTRKKATGASC